MSHKISAIFFFCFLFAATTLADTKVKIRQTMQGQTYENTTYFKGKRQRAEQNMGGMETVTLTQCDQRRNVRLMPASKTYLIDPFAVTTDTKPEPAAAATKPQPATPVQKGGVITTTYDIKDTGERKQMFGYTARHLIITMESESSPDACTQQKSKMQTDGWYIDATFGGGCDEQNYTPYRPGARNGGCQDRYQMKQTGNGKRGFALWEKMTMFDERGKETYSFLNEVIELSSATLDAALFEIPADYREVKDANELYASLAINQGSQRATSSVPSSNNLINTMPTAKANAAPSAAPAAAVGAKKAGVVRFGLSNVKVSAVGEGLNAAELATAIQNSLVQYLKAPNIEVVALEAALPAAIEAEAKQKECDYVIYSSIAHKKGGVGFGMKAFSGVIAPTVGRIGIGHTGSVAGNIAGQVATQAIVSAGTMAASVKAKDEVTFDVQLRAPGNATPATSKQLKAKAKADGEDILTPMIEQAAQAIFDAGAKL